MRVWGPRWLFACLPFLVGLVVSIIVGSSEDGNQLFTLSITLNYLILLPAIVLSLVLLVGVAVWYWRSVEQHSSEAELRTNFEEDRRRFLRRLDHELKNPLTGINLGLDNLSSADRAGQTQAFESISAQANRLTRLISDLRKLADIDTRSLEKIDVNLESLLREAVDIAKDHPDAPDRNITLSVPQAPWPLPKISADWDLMFLAIYNLIENAIKFTEVDDNIEIRAREDSGRVLIEVADTGPGIDKVDVDHVWEELYRGFRTRSISGSGLGLPLVKSIVERHDGQVGLVSREGIGSVFSIDVPVG
ncbi:MAG: HAMP domain-containing sensor histidine kinase [Chloroflexota bacterium]